MKNATKVPARNSNSATARKAAADAKARLEAAGDLAAKEKAFMTATAPLARVATGATSGIVNSAMVEQTRTGTRYVMSLRNGNRHVYFSFPLNKPKAAEIGRSQLRLALEDIPVDADPIRHILLNRSKYVGRKVNYSETPQLDGEGRQMASPEGRAYYNVRLEPSSTDMTADALDALLGGNGLAASSTEAEGVTDLSSVRE